MVRDEIRRVRRLMDELTSIDETIIFVSKEIGAGRRNEVMNSLLNKLNKVKEVFSSELVGGPRRTYYERLMEQVKGLRPLAEQADGDLDRTIQVLGLSSRVYNRLEANRIIYLGHLLQYNERELRDCLGEKGINEVKNKLGRLGLELGIDAGYIFPENRS